MCVIDEVGKMELFSQPFAQAVRQTLSAPGTVVLGTIPVPKGKPLALVEEIRSRADVRVFSVSAAALGAAGRGGPRQRAALGCPRGSGWPSSLPFHSTSAGRRFPALPAASAPASLRGPRRFRGGPGRCGRWSASS